MLSTDPETLKIIQETAVDAAGANGKAVIVELPHEPKHVYGLISNGSFSRVTAEAQGRTITLNSVDQIPPYALLAKDQMSGAPAIYFSKDRVVCVVDDSLGSHRQDLAIVNLTITPEFEVLQTLGKQQFTQKEFISLLRVTLDDCKTPDVAKLISTCRAVDFSSKTTGSSSVGHGRESLGMDIQEEVISKAGEIPEEVSLNVRPYQDRALQQRHQVKCMVDLDVKQGLFKLTPLPADIQNLFDSEMEFLERILGECTCPIHYGSPGK